MSKQIISSGTLANDRTGDSLRNTAGKINANFNELYSSLGNGTNLSVSAVAKTGNYQDLTNKPTLFSGDYNDLTNKPVQSTVNLGSVSQHILPSVDVTYDLGSATNRFRDLYLSGNTINLGGSTISNVGGAIVFSAAPGITIDTLDVLGWTDYGNNVDINVGDAYDVQAAGYSFGPYLDGAVPSIRYAFGNEPANPATWTFTFDGSGYIQTITMDTVGDPIQFTDQFEFLWYPNSSSSLTPSLSYPTASTNPIVSTDTLWNSGGKELYINRDYLGAPVSVTGTGWTGADFVPGGIGGRSAALKLPDNSITFDGSPNGLASGVAIGAAEDAFSLSFLIARTQQSVAQIPSVSSVPAHSIGQPGDITGMVAADSMYFYYCIGAFDGVTNIWKRNTWSNDTW